MLLFHFSSVIRAKYFFCHSLKLINPTVNLCQNFHQVNLAYSSYPFSNTFHSIKHQKKAISITMNCN